MRQFPYAGLPVAQVWKRAVSDVPAAEIDPQGPAKWRIGKEARIASAGSCFARRIADRLREAGYHYFVTEPGGGYSARYGDIYTALQLAQLARRAIGDFVPAEPAWEKGGRFYDPLRPREQPGGFASVAAMEAERRRHLEAVLRLLSESDVFIFTLGLTEVWCSRADRTAFPLCPGAGIGVFDDRRYAFRNLSVDETVQSLEDFLETVWALNPSLRILLTVSPVPLAVTAEPRHVIQSTVYSKAVLRVAAEQVRRRYEQVDYFAAYEMVANGIDGLDHYDPDRREVSEAAVDRVMGSFFAAYGNGEAEPAALPTLELTTEMVAAAAASRTAAEDPCDELYLAQHVTTG
jgi:hypothetical protein